MHTHAGIYHTHKFPAYKFVEYPKWVRTADGESLLVHDRREEMDAEIDRGLVKEPASPLAAERDDLALQLAEAQALIAELRSAKAAQAKVESPPPVIGPVGTKRA